MTLDFLDYFILVILAIVIIGILIGKGDAVLNLFKGKTQDPNAPKYDPKKEQKAVLYYCFLLLFCEFLMILGRAYAIILVYIAMALIVIGGIVVFRWLKKNALK